MASVYVTKDQSGEVTMQENEPICRDRIFWYRQAGSGPGEQARGPLIDKLVKGLSLRRGQCKRVKLVELKDD